MKFKTRILYALAMLLACAFGAAIAVVLWGAFIASQFRH